jgi:hypothetical protein
MAPPFMNQLSAISYQPSAKPDAFWGFADG